MSPILTARFIRIAALSGAVLISYSAFAQTKTIKKTPGKSVRVASNPASQKAKATAAASAKTLPNLSTVSGLKAHIEALQKTYKLRRVDMLRYREERTRLLSEGKFEEAEKLEEKNEANEKRLDVYNAMLYYLQLRAFPKDHLDYDSYVKAQDHRDKMPAAKVKTYGKAAKAGVEGVPGGATGALANPIWEFVGPKNAYSTSPSGQGPPDTQYIGRVNNVAYDQKIEGNVYLTSPSGGVWKSVNGGTDWTPLGDAFSSLKVTAVAASNDLVLVGMGDYEYSWGGIYSKGLMRSEDGGATFSAVTPKGLELYSVSAITIDPDDANIVHLTSGRGGAGAFFVIPTAAGVSGLPDYWSYMYRSVDGGKTFLKAKVPGGRGLGDWSDIKYGVADAKGVRSYFAACSWPSTGSTPGLYRSTDRGANWTRLTLPAVPAPFSLYYVRLSVAPSAVDPKIVYVMYGDEARGIVRFWKGLQRGNNNAFTWIDITGNTPTDAGQCTYNMHFRAVPFTGGDGVAKDVLYAGTRQFGASFGDGVWYDISKTYTGQDAFHTDQHAMNFNPFKPDQMIVTNDGGAYGLTVDSANFDPQKEDKNWTVNGLVNKTLGITEFYFADFAANDPNIMLGGAQDNSTPASIGDLDLWTNVGIGDGGGAAINPADPANQYSTLQGYYEIFDTKDLWASGLNDVVTPYRYGYWWFDYENVPFVGQILHDPASNAMYIASDYLWRYDADKDDWTPDMGGKPLAGYGGSIKCIAVAPSDSAYIYTGSNDGQIWMSSDGGASFTFLTDINLPYRAVTGISVHPTKPNDILVTFAGNGNGQLYWCKDTSAAKPKFLYKGGYGITRLPDITANDVTRDPLNPDTNWFVGTDIGIFYTATAGTDWGNATGPLGLPNVQITTLKAMPGTGYVMASTYGRGIWRLDISNGVTVPIEDSIGISLSVAGFQRQGRTISAKLTITNDRDVTASQIQFDTMTVTVGARAVKAQPIPLNVGAIPGSKNGSKYFIVKNISFPVIGKSGDKATLTVTGTMINDGPRTFTRTVDFVIP